MGYWKDVAYDMQRGMSRATAEKLNAELRYGKLSKEEKAKLEAKAEAEIKLRSMR